LEGKPEGKGPLVRTRHRWKSNITMGLQEVGWGFMDWIVLSQDRGCWQAFVNAVMKLQDP
jgi:hypothetical protein